MRSLSVVVLAALAVCSLALVGVSGARFTKGTRAAGTLQVRGCTDVRPPGSQQYTCAQQKGWGKCGESWMKGYCKVTCNTCGASAPAPATKPAASGGSSSLEALHIQVTNSHETAPLKHYPNYSVNKKKTLHALQAAGLSQAQVRMAMAIGMLETNTYDPAQRDKSKTGPSTNWSAFNINTDMLERAGVNNHSTYNSLSGLPNVAKGIKALIKRYGVNGFLNYLRGGYQGWTTGTAYGCVDYRNAIASMVRIIDANPSLLTDDRRIDMVVKHV